MTESDLELWLSNVLTIRQAFRDVAKRGAADHVMAMSYLNRAMLELGKIEREERTIEEDKSGKDAFNAAVTDTVREQLRSGPTNTERVFEKLVESPRFARLIVQQQSELAHRQARSVIAKELNRTVTTPAEASKRMEYHSSQPELAFFNIEEFRGVPRTLAFVDDKTQERLVIPYTQSLVIHREYSLKQHKTRNRQAEKRYKAELEADLALQPLVKKFGDLPAAELWQKKTQRRRDVN